MLLPANESYCYQSHVQAYSTRKIEDFIALRKACRVIAAEAWELVHGANRYPTANQLKLGFEFSNVVSVLAVS